MRTIQGVSVSAGIAIGTVRVLAAVDYAVERRLIDDPQAEMDRFRAARDTAVAQLKQLRDNVAAEFGENKAELFDAHRLMLRRRFDCARQGERRIRGEERRRTVRRHVRCDG